MSTTTSSTAAGEPAARQAAPGPVDPSSLCGLPFDELDRLFASLDAPEPEQLRGTLRGRIVSATGIERAGASLRRPMARALQLVSLPFWQGKRLEGERGTNLWLAPVGLAYGAFTVSRDDHGSASLDYDVASNPRLLRPILGELRLLGPGLYLGRMDYRGRRGRSRIHYFVLES